MMVTDVPRKHYKNRSGYTGRDRLPESCSAACCERLLVSGVLVEAFDWEIATPVFAPLPATPSPSLAHVLHFRRSFLHLCSIERSRAWCAVVVCSSRKIGMSHMLVNLFSSALGSPMRPWAESRLVA